MEERKTMQEKEHVLCMRLRKGDKGGDRGLGRARDRERERELLESRAVVKNLHSEIYLN